MPPHCHGYGQRKSSSPVGSSGQSQLETSWNILRVNDDDDDDGGGDDDDDDDDDDNDDDDDDDDGHTLRVSRKAWLIWLNLMTCNHYIYDNRFIKAH